MQWLSTLAELDGDCDNVDVADVDVGEVDFDNVDNGKDGAQSNLKLFIEAIRVIMIFQEIQYEGLANLAKNFLKLLLPPKKWLGMR